MHHYILRAVMFKYRINPAGATGSSVSVKAVKSRNTGVWRRLTWCCCTASLDSGCRRRVQHILADVTVDWWQVVGGWSRSRSPPPWSPVWLEVYAEVHPGRAGTAEESGWAALAWRQRPFCVLWRWLVRGSYSERWIQEAKHYDETFTTLVTWKVRFCSDSHQTLHVPA